MDPTTFQMPLRIGNAFAMQGTMEQWSAIETRGITPGRMDNVAGVVMSWGMMQRVMCGTLWRVEIVVWGVGDGECATGRTRMK